MDEPSENASTTIIIPPERLPGLLVRVQAIVVDAILIFVTFITFAYLLDSFGEEYKTLRSVGAIILIYLYDPLMVSYFGGTLGHRLMGLEIKKMSQLQENISPGVAILRFAAKGLLGWFSFLTVTANKNNRAIHDMVSGSIVLIKSK